MHKLPALRHTWSCPKYLVKIPANLWRLGQNHWLHLVKVNNWMTMPTYGVQGYWACWTAKTLLITHIIYTYTFENCSITWHFNMSQKNALYHNAVLYSFSPVPTGYHFILTVPTHLSVSHSDGKARFSSNCVDIIVHFVCQGGCNQWS